MSELRIITVAAYPEEQVAMEQAQPLIDSSRRWATTPLRLMQIRTPFDNFYQNKVVRLLHDLKSDYDRSKYLLYCDATDTLLLRDPRNAIGALKSYGRPVLLGAECICWPWPKRHGPLFASVELSPLRYPQAGVWIGEYDAVVASLERIKLRVDHDKENYREGRFGFDNEDQVGWAQNVIDGVPIALDTEARLVANMNNAEPGLFELGETVHCPRTGNSPVVMHWAGGPNSKRNLRKYAQRQNLYRHTP